MSDFLIFTFVILALGLMTVGIIFKIAILPLISILFWIGLAIEISTATGNNWFILPFILLSFIQVFIFILIRNGND